MFICRVITLAAFLMLLPHSAAASVVIHEIAWMGSLTSANDEWIELHNTGAEARSLDGWVLTDGQSLNIQLTGTIPAGGYAVLERTDDDSAPGTAFLIYTGALSNTGATLRLYNDAGTLSDQVAGGDNWELIGGDNVTKETAQLTSAGWVTAQPTPGTQNSTLGRTNENTDGRTSSRNSAAVLAKPVQRPPSLVPSTKELSLSLMAPMIVYVNQAITLEAIPSDIGNTIVASLQYEWNFGDLSTSTGKRAQHIYQYPGEYLVTVRAHFARHDTVAEYLVKVLPVRFSLTLSSAGDIQVHNDSSYDIDVSGFTLTGEKTKEFPDRSRIVKNGTITVPHEAFGGTKLGQVYLRDATGSVVAFLSPAPPVVSEPSVTVEKMVNAPLIVPVPQSAAVASQEAFAFASSTRIAAEIEPENEEVVVAQTIPLAAAAITADTPSTDEWWSMAGLLGIILLGLASVYFGAQKT